MTLLIHHTLFLYCCQLPNFRSLRSGTNTPEELDLNRGPWKKDSHDDYMRGSKQIGGQETTLKHRLHRIWGSFKLSSLRSRDFIGSRVSPASTHPLAKFRFVNTFLNWVICGSVLLVAFIFVFEFFMARIIRWDIYYFNLKSCVHLF